MKIFEHQLYHKHASYVIALLRTKISTQLLQHKEKDSSSLIPTPTPTTTSEKERKEKEVMLLKRMWRWLTLMESMALLFSSNGNNGGPSTSTCDIFSLEHLPTQKLISYMMFDGSIPQYTDHTHMESYKALELYYRQKSSRESRENRQTASSTTTNGLGTLSALLYTLNTENNKAKTNNPTAVYTTMMSAIVNDTALLDFLNNPLEHQVTMITQLLVNNNRNSNSNNNNSNNDNNSSNSNKNNQNGRTCTRSMLSSGVLEVLLLELERLNGETTPGATTFNRFDDPLTTMEKKKQHQLELVLKKKQVREERRQNRIAAITAKRNSGLSKKQSGGGQTISSGGSGGGETKSNVAAFGAIGFNGGSGSSGGTTPFKKKKIPVKKGQMTQRQREKAKKNKEKMIGTILRCLTACFGCTLEKEQQQQAAEEEEEQERGEVKGEDRAEKTKDESESNLRLSSMIKHSSILNVVRSQLLVATSGSEIEENPSNYAASIGLLLSLSTTSSVLEGINQKNKNEKGKLLLCAAVVACVSIVSKELH